MPTGRTRGGALLMVLWVSVALSAIGFSLASTVRGEAERTGTAVDGLRGYYLAVGGIQRCMIELLWSATHQEKRAIPKGSTVVHYEFPSGSVDVEIMPEAGKLDVNRASPVELVRLMLALGEPEDRARAITASILDWRGPGTGASDDSFYRAQVPSFRSPHSSFQEIEELLLVKGVTPELFYGTYVPSETLDGAAATGSRLVRRGGLFDCLTVYAGDGRVDANTANPAVLLAVGLGPIAVRAVIERRAIAPLTEGQLGEIIQQAPAGAERLRLEGHSIVTMRATARLRTPAGLSDLKRSVAAQIKYLHPGSKSAVNVLRWYDMAWSN
jgi:general secretion pathway protein K